MDSMKKNIVLTIGVIFMGLGIAGGTFAWLSASANITNGTYTAMTHCFLVDYNIDNGDGTQDITGTMFPSSNALGGLNGRVGLKINDSCELYGTATLKLHINSETSNVLTTSIASYCESRKTLEKIDGITTKEACTTANGRWMEYGDNYCENPTTLERLKDYMTQSDCESNNGTWTAGGSPLKYAVYNTEDITQSPISVGHITSNDIGHDITIKDDILVSKAQKYFYIYVWLDGYMTDNTFTDLAFSGSVSASAIQNNEEVPSGYQRVEYLKSSGSQYINTGIIANQDTGFDIYFSTENMFSGSGYGSIFGARYSSAVRELQLTTYSTGSFTGTLRYGGSSNDAGLQYVGQKVHAMLLNKIYTTNSGTQTTLNATFTTPVNITIFALNENGNIIQSGKLSLYSFKIYDGNNLIRDFIPCYNKTTLVRGLYDTVHDVFYTNAGSGTFEIGSEM